MNEQKTIESKQSDSGTQDRSASAIALEQVAAFYNNYTSKFLEFEEETGVNVWFLKYFRVYFSCRELVAVQNSNLRTRTEQGSVSKKKQSIFKSLYRALNELFHVLSCSGKVEMSASGILLIASIKEIKQGAFGELHDKLEQVQNREVFNLKKPFSKSAASAWHNLSSDRILGNYLISFSAFTELVTFHRRLKTFRGQLLQEITESNSSDVDIAKMVFSNHGSLLVYYARYRAFCKHFEKYPSKGILMTDENSPQQKVIQYAARKNEVKVFAYQHGNIHRWNPAYNYSLFQNKPNLADITFVWGEHSKNMLTSWGGYSDDTVSISGRLDPSKATRLKNPKLKTTKKLIIYATQPQEFAKMQVQYLTDVMSAVSRLSDTHQLVIRPHPAETDDTEFTSAAESVGYADLIIDRESDLVTHMQECDFLITAFSTVGTEFIPFYKPLIVMDYLDEDLLGWVSSGVGIPVHNEDEISSVLQTDQMISRESYDAFVQHHFFKVDGNAAQRIIDAIDKHN